MYTTGSKELEVDKTYEVISVCCPTPCYISPCQNGIVPENCSVVLHTRAKGNICKSGGVSGEHAAERAQSLCWQETPSTEWTVFLLPYFILNVKAFTLQWHPKMILLLPLKQYFFMLHRVPTSWFKNQECNRALCFSVPWKEKEQAGRISWWGEKNPPFECIYSISKHSSPF